MRKYKYYLSYRFTENNSYGEGDCYADLEFPLNSEESIRKCKALISEKEKENGRKIICFYLIRELDG